MSASITIKLNPVDRVKAVVSIILFGKIECGIPNRLLIKAYKNALKEVIDEKSIQK